MFETSFQTKARESSLVYFTNFVCKINQGKLKRKTKFFFLVYALFETKFQTKELFRQILFVYPWSKSGVLNLLFYNIVNIYFKIS